MATFDPNKMASFRGDEDPASPTTIIFKQMQAAGIPLNAGNIRDFMQRIRSSPDEPGQVDKAAGGNFDYETADRGQQPAALRIERGSDDTAGANTGQAPSKSTPAPTPVDTRSGDQRAAAESPRVTDARSGDQRSSAQPAPSIDIPIDPMSGATATGGPGSVDTSLGTGGKLGLGALILGGAQLIPGLMDRIRGNDARLAPILNPQAAPVASTAGPTITVPPTVPPTAAPPTDMEVAMQKATAPANDRLGLTGISGGMGLNPPQNVAGAQNEIGILTGERPPPMMPPLNSNPANRVRVPDANVTVRGRVPVRGLRLRG